MGLTEGHLADIRHRRDLARQHGHWMPTVTADRYDRDVSALLVEIARLRLLVDERDERAAAGMSIGDGIARIASLPPHVNQSVATW